MRGIRPVRCATVGPRDRSLVGRGGLFGFGRLGRFDRLGQGLALPRRLAAGGGGRLFVQEIGKVETGFHGEHAHGSSFRVRPDDDGGPERAGHRGSGESPKAGVWDGYALFRGGKIGGR